MNLPSIDCKTASIAELKKAFYMKLPITGITCHVSHFGPHNDELLPMFLISGTPEGIKLFPGNEHAGIRYLSNSELRKHNLYGEEGFFKAMKMGYLLYGIGGGPFDEHRNRAEHKSCIDLVVNHLDLLKTPYNRDVYGALINYVSFEDQNGDNLIQILNKENPAHVLTPQETGVLRKIGLGGLAHNLKKGFESVSSDEEYKEVILGAFQFYKNNIRQAKLFFDAKKEYERVKKNFVPILVDNTECMILEMQSDHRVIHKVIANKWPAYKREKLGVVFIHKSNGQFVLMPGKGMNVTKMEEVVKILRQKVILTRKLPLIQFKDLAAEETLDAVPEIHYAKSTGTISNGANVDPDVPGLIGVDLTVDDIINAIIVGLEKVFPKRLSEGCLKGVCAKDACGFYNFNLMRCNVIREQSATALDSGSNEKAA